MVFLVRLLLFKFNRINFKAYRYFALLFCCYLPVVGFGQANTHDLEGLEGPFARMTNIADTVDIKKTLSRVVQIARNFPDSARQLTLTAYQKSKTLSYQYGMGWALHILGNLEQWAGDYEQSILYLEEAIIHLNTSKANVHLATPILGIGSAWFYQSEYHKALNSNYRALNTLEEFGCPVAPADSVQAYLNIALIWLKLQSLTQAKAALKKAEGVRYLFQDSTLLVQFYAHAASAYTNKDPQLALGYLQKAIAVAQAKKLHENLLGSLHTTASIYNYLKKPDSTLYYLKISKSILDRYPDAYRHQRFHYDNQRGAALYLKKEYKKAEKIFQALYKTLKKNTGLDEIRMTLEENMAILYAATGRDSLALQHTWNYAQIMRNIYKEKNAQVIELSLKLLQEQNNKALVKKELRIEQQQHTIQKKNFWIWGTGIGLILLCSTLIAFIRNHRHKQIVQRSRIRQIQQEQEIRQLKAQVDGEEKERNRISIELHDNVGSLLTTAIYTLQTVSKAKPTDMNLQRARTLLKQIHKEIRNTSHTLMPDVLLGQSFSEGILEYCAFIERDTGLRIDLQLQGPFDHISQDIKLLFYRILQELLQNILKHAQAEKVLIQLHASTELLSLTVEDDGIGFNPDREDQGKGFKNIENRLKIFNGHMSYDTTFNKGSSIYLEVSLDNTGLNK